MLRPRGRIGGDADGNMLLSYKALPYGWLTRYGSDWSYMRHSEGARRTSKGRHPLHTVSCREFMVEIVQSLSLWRQDIRLGCNLQRTIPSAAKEEEGEPTKEAVRGCLRSTDGSTLARRRLSHQHLFSPSTIPMQKSSKFCCWLKLVVLRTTTEVREVCSGGGW